MFSKATPHQVTPTVSFLKLPNNYNKSTTYPEFEKQKFISTKKYTYTVMDPR